MIGPGSLVELVRDDFCMSVDSGLPFLCFKGQKLIIEAPATGPGWIARLVSLGPVASIHIATLVVPFDAVALP